MGEAGQRRQSFLDKKDARLRTSVRYQELDHTKGGICFQVRRAGLSAPSFVFPSSLKPLSLCESLCSWFLVIHFLKAKSTGDAVGIIEHF
jgi:hypothetical protein